ncbi:MAG: serine/threonine-protein kinase [Steroidobacteraceae bacterium]
MQATLPIPFRPRSAKAAEFPPRLGKYDLIRKVGEGSSGTVFLSHDPFQRRDVAVKVYARDGELEQKHPGSLRSMFLAEARMVGRLQHPNLLPIYDAGREQGLSFVASEFVHGARTLAAYTAADNLLPMDVVISLAHKCARALHYAHGEGVIHRDIKPSNLMLTPEGDLRIIDFGISLTGEGGGTGVEGIAGSPSYMSPEQVQSLPLGGASDQFSLGAVLYQLLSGSRPFRAPTLDKLLHRIVYSTPEPLHRLRPDVPAALEHIVGRAMHKDPAARFSSGLELAGELERALLAIDLCAGQPDESERFGRLRRLDFFQDFSAEEIAQLMKAGSWREYGSGEEIVREGAIDDRFYVVVGGECEVRRGGELLARLVAGDCFGESGYVRGARRQASINAGACATVLRISSTLLEQVTQSCQLRFNQAFLRSMIVRLQSGSSRPESLRS